MIYLYHIPKTGGTSVNMSFLSLGGHDGDALYGALGSAKPHSLTLDGRIFIGWNAKLIQKTDFFYAFSHEPVWRIHLRPDTFTMTCFRNPESRVLSHYQEILAYKELHLAHSANLTEGEWLGDSFSDYLTKTPVKFLNGQVYMFSREGCVSEAEEVIRNLSFHWFLEEFELGMKGLSKILGLPLEIRHDRKSRLQYLPSKKERLILRELLAPDWELYRRLHD